VSSNEFIGNIATFGGAIYAENSLMNLYLIDNLFHGNSAQDGGAIYKKSLSTFYLSLIEILFLRKRK